jgi:uncharacterized protein GlcG (DUF336 family)
MRHLTVIAGAFCVALVLGTTAFAQQLAVPSAPPSPPPPPPEYGSTVTIDQAKKAVAAAVVQAKTTPYLYVFAVVDPTGSLVYFEKMDGASYSSVDIAINKARSSAEFRRPSKAFFDAMEAGHSFQSTLAPYVVASPGGLLLMVDGKIAGAIGVSGGANGLIDQTAAQAGVDALK